MKESVCNKVNLGVSNCHNHRLEGIIKFLNPEAPNAATLQYLISYLFGKFDENGGSGSLLSFDRYKVCTDPRRKTSTVQNTLQQTDLLPSNKVKPLDQPLLNVTYPYDLLR